MRGVAAAVAVLGATVLRSVLAYISSGEGNAALTPKVEPWHVMAEVPPQLPSVLTVGPAGGVGSGSGVLVGIGSIAGDDDEGVDAEQVPKAG